MSSAMVHEVSTEALQLAGLYGLVEQSKGMGRRNCWCLNSVGSDDILTARDRAIRKFAKSCNYCLAFFP